MSTKEFQHQNELYVRIGEFGEPDQLIRPQGEVKLTIAELRELDAAGKINWLEDVIYS
jgi:hypothetical protein